MAAEDEYVVETEIGLRPEPGAPAPLLAQSEHDCYLVFNAVQEPGGAIGTGVVEAVGCDITRFGYPNDEAIAGHPLWARGLNPYAVSEVIHSSWVTQLDEQNRVAFPDYNRPPKRHFIIAFHDSTFECVADELNARIVNVSREEAYAEIAKSLE